MQGRPLSTFKLSHVTCIPQVSVQPQPPVPLGSPGRAVTTDLTVVRAATAMGRIRGVVSHAQVERALV